MVLSAFQFVFFAFIFHRMDIEVLLFAIDVDNNLLLRRIFYCLALVSEPFFSKFSNNNKQQIKYFPFFGCDYYYKCLVSVVRTFNCW